MYLVKNSNIFCDQNDIKNVKTEFNSLYIKDNDYFDKISINFIHNVFIDNDLYNYFLFVFNNKAEHKLVFVNSNTNKKKEFNFSEINEQLKKYNSKNNIYNVRYSYFRCLTNYLQFLDDYNDYSHSVLINDQVYSINFDTIVKILNFNNNNFFAYLNEYELFNYNSKIINYIIIDFINRENILKKYTLIDNVYNRIKQIESITDYNEDNVKYNISRDIVRIGLKDVKLFDKLSVSINIYNNLIDDVHFINDYVYLLKMQGIHPFVNMLDDNGNIIKFTIGEYDIAYNDGRLVCLSKNKVSYNKFYNLYNEIRNNKLKEDSYEISKNRKR